MTTKEKIIYAFSILFVSVVFNFFLVKIMISRSNQKEELKDLLNATDSIFTSVDYLSRGDLTPPQKAQIKDEIEKAREALRSSRLLDIRLESYLK